MATSRSSPGALVVCADAVILDKFTEKITTIGMVDSVACAGFPAPFNFVAVAKLWGLPPSGSNKCVIRLLDLGGGDVLAESPVHNFHTNMQGAALGVQHTAVHRFAGEFDHPGLYEVQVIINGQKTAGFPVAVGQINEETAPN